MKNFNYNRMKINKNRSKIYKINKFKIKKNYYKL